MCHENSSIEPEPIPLTEEWLVKFGWGKDTEYDNTYLDNTSLKHNIMIYDTLNKVFMLETNSDTIEFNHIKYVHQLQNLYHALTGNELEIKE